MITITKSLSLIGNPGFFAGIAASSGSAINIATASVKVILRNLSINGLGAASYGVNMSNGSSLTIENCLIYNFSTYGVYVTGPIKVQVSDSTIRGNTSDGIHVQSGVALDLNNSKLLSNGMAQ